MGNARPDAAERLFPCAFFSSGVSGNARPETHSLPTATARRLDTSHPANHFLGKRAVKVSVRGRAAEPSMRAHAGLAAERIDHQPAVVGDRRQVGAGEIEARLEQRVLAKRGPGFFWSV